MEEEEEEALVAIMVATEGITKVTTRVEVEVEAMEEMVMTTMAMVCVVVSYHLKRLVNAVELNATACGYR